MSAAINDGGPAFPNVPDGAGDKWSDWDKGLSLRDYFAAQALAGIEASQGNSGHFVSTAEKVALRAYELADAMLKARAA
ncbi:hypothetical protein [Roseateles sp.]|uniref:hypothetical protein n=1 Tax=Roseateles sp. TaxID=1971397 RepID=UPI0031D133BF